MAMEVSVRILEDAISASALDRGGETAWGNAGDSTERTTAYERKGDRVFGGV